VIRSYYQIHFLLAFIQSDNLLCALHFILEIITLESDWHLQNAKRSQMVLLMSNLATHNFFEFILSTLPIILFLIFQSHMNLF